MYGSIINKIKKNNFKCPCIKDKNNIRCGKIAKHLHVCSLKKGYFS